MRQKNIKKFNDLRSKLVTKLLDLDILLQNQNIQIQNNFCVRVIINGAVYVRDPEESDKDAIKNEMALIAHDIRLLYEFLVGSSFTKIDNDLIQSIKHICADMFYIACGFHISDCSSAPEMFSLFLKETKERHLLVIPILKISFVITILYCLIWYWFLDWNATTCYIEAPPIFLALLAVLSASEHWLSLISVILWRLWSIQWLKFSIPSKFKYILLKIKRKL